MKAEYSRPSECGKRSSRSSSISFPRPNPIDDVAHSLQPLLDLYEQQGDGDMPYPPDYPKMPGEPKRVQPSRDLDRRRRRAV